MEDMLNKYNLPWAKYRLYDLKWFVQSLGKAMPLKYESNDEEYLIKNASNYNEVLKKKEIWYKIQYLENFKIRDDGSYTP